MARTHGKDTATVLEEIKKFHSNLLFDKFEYKDSKTKVTIGCDIHGYFEKYPNDMKNGRGGCPRCNNSFHRTHTDFITELATLHPHIKCLDNYKNSNIKLNFTCKKHNHSFISQPYTILAGHINCPECYSSKQTDTRVKKGQISDPELKSEYELYRRAVWRFSNRAYKQHLSEQKRDRHNHLDHILSIVEGFKNKVPAEIIGSIHNLQIINGQANRHKSYRSDITVEQLLERYNK
jgi:hypothetical protein